MKAIEQPEIEKTVCDVCGVDLRDVKIGRASDERYGMIEQEHGEGMSIKIDIFIKYVGTPERQHKTPRKMWKQRHADLCDACWRKVIAWYASHL